MMGWRLCKIGPKARRSSFRLEREREGLDFVLDVAEIGRRDVIGVG
jgi:hypothetical protein